MASSTSLLLIVEHDPKLRKLLRVTLEDDPYVILEAGDGAEALEVARAFRPDLILIDCVLPQFDGVRLVDRLKSDPNTRHIPVVALTAGDPPTIRALQRAGVDAHFIEPFSPAELSRFVNERLHVARRSWPTTPLGFTPRAFDGNAGRSAPRLP
ncbi:MAG TPA: response regulator [Chloroflexota bacterium]